MTSEKPSERLQKKTWKEFFAACFTDGVLSIPLAKLLIGGGVVLGASIGAHAVLVKEKEETRKQLSTVGVGDNNQKTPDQGNDQVVSRRSDHTQKTEKPSEKTPSKQTKFPLRAPEKATKKPEESFANKLLSGTMLEEDENIRNYFLDIASDLASEADIAALFAMLHGENGFSETLKILKKHCSSLTIALVIGLITECDVCYKDAPDEELLDTILSDSDLAESYLQAIQFTSQDSNGVFPEIRRFLYINDLMIKKYQKHFGDGYPEESSEELYQKLLEKKPQKKTYQIQVLETCSKKLEALEQARLGGEYYLEDGLKKTMVTNLTSQHQLVSFMLLLESDAKKKSALEKRLQKIDTLLVEFQ